MMAMEGTANVEAVDAAEAEVAKVAEVEGCIGCGGMHRKCWNVSEEHGGGRSCQR
jgi:succinate dehydrogenase/fumarate reductase-like Fe-S protein